VSENVPDCVLDESAWTRGRVSSSWRLPAAVFVGVLVAGLFCGLGTPPFSGYDEFRHFAHAWQVSDGRLFPRDGRIATGAHAQGGVLPSGVVHDMNTLFIEGRSHDPARLFANLGNRASGGSPEFVDFSNVASYSIVSYLPAATGIRVGRLIGASTLLLVVLARLFGLIAYAALATLAVWRVPTRRGLIAVLCLTPVAIVQASTVSADGITIGLSILVVAEALRLAVQPRRAVTRASCIEAGITLIALALAKPPYVLFGLLYITAIVRQRGFAAKLLGLAGGAAAALAAGWNAWASRHYVQQYFGPAQFDTHHYAYRGVNSTRQLTYVAAHPWSFVAVLGRTLRQYGSSIVHDVVMQSPAWHAPAWMTAMEFVVLIGAAAMAVDLSDLSFVRTIGAVTVGLTTLAVFVLAYAGWNQLRAPRIDALDGRYFFPVLALSLLAFTPVLGHRLSEPTRRMATGALFATQFILVLGFACATVHNTYVPSGPNPLHVSALRSVPITLRPHTRALHE
jgi:uncharacterized membrane protein